ncbi:RNA polymerase, sigma-24 subunit, ECF subfamily [Kribbella flavida DSM 17836]|uniref:RNA polymerase, sigma-24 subunit, ECF subfamily n=1 Tax=Kribbella flavida (strain DSM 17836 / JCM 10339 / NBRC 14399) TaxID=479435 RepID=D2PKW3_KRIFD|nr:sigma-70 family RNA polymerase sigma factor [Kribbella flavida]ADB32430.1 RNA polymerase, sigma-24 subunit, ECF subfamily [Kribbella flavida DSM 17836]
MDELPVDGDLIRRLRDRDESAFTLVLDRWSPGLRRLARTFVSTDESAAEVVQETWLAVIEGIDRFEGRSSLRTWVYRILTNTAKRRGSRERRVVPISSDDGPTVDPSRFQEDGPFPGHWWEFPPAWPTPEQGVLRHEVQELLTQTLMQLPERQRVVLALRDADGWSSEEVCELLGVTAANQRVLLHRARAFVRGKLEQYYTQEATS